MIISLVSRWLNTISWQATKKYVTGIFFWESLLKNIKNSNQWLSINGNFPWANVFVSGFNSAFSFHFVFFFAALNPLCLTNTPLPHCSCSIFLFLIVTAAFLWLLPLLSSGSRCFYHRTPDASAIAFLLLLPMVSWCFWHCCPIVIHKAQELQPGQELKKILNCKNRLNLQYS